MIRTRQLANGKWICEHRRMWRWRAVRIDRSTTTVHCVEAGRKDMLPRLRYEVPGDVHYPLTWHDTREALNETCCEVYAMLGRSKPLSHTETPRDAKLAP